MHPRIDSLSGVVAALGNTSGLTAQSAQVVQLGAAHTALTHELDGVDDGECSGKRRSTPVPKLILRTTKVSRTPAPLRAITTPVKVWIRELLPSWIFTFTSTVSPGRKAGDFLGRLHVLGVKSLNSVNHCFPSVLPHISHRSGAIHAITHRARWPVLVIPRVCPWEACRSAESQALRPFGLDPWRRGLMRRPTSRHSNRPFYGLLRTVSACRRLSPLLTHQFGRGSTDGGFEYFPPSCWSHGYRRWY